jgi:hypothetical protein
MNKRLNIGLWFFAVTALVLASCSDDLTPVHKKVTVPQMTIHIVSDRQLFNAWQAREASSGIAAYADGKEIWILGYMSGGKVYIKNEAVEWLGHELWEHMRLNDPEIANPHDKKFWMN